MNLKKWCIENARDDLLDEWDYEKNISLTPNDCSHGSEKVIWWICKKGHSWKASVNSRTCGSGCPYCSGRLAIPGENDLATINPSLALEWHPTANGNLLPQNVKNGSNKRVWWLCSVCGYEWEAVISSRGTGGHGCPECAKKKNSDLRKTPPVTQSLFEKYPEIAAEWDYSRNYPLTPKDVFARSSQSVFWKCDKGHQWEATIGNRTAGRGCPVCANKKIQRGFNDLATLNPELAKEWHPTKNEMTASEIAPSSNKQIWWLCSICGHEWRATVNNRTKRGCPSCSNGMRVSFPEKAIAFYLRLAGLEIEENYRPKWLKGKELDIYIPTLRLGIEYDGEKWHNSGRNDLNKDVLCLGNGVSLIHIREPNCPRIMGVTCYVLPDRKENTLNLAIEFIYEILCEEYNVIIPEDVKIDVVSNRTEIYELLELGKKRNSLEVTHPDLAGEWHLTRNGNITPDKVTKGSDKIVWWQCKYGHAWESSVSHRVSGRGCPFCAGKRILVGFNDFQTLYPELMKEWDWEKNEDIVVEKIRKTSSQQIWWKCNKGHSWQAAVNTRVNGASCPVCSGKTVLVGFNDLATTRPDLVSEWHTTKNVEFSPDRITKDFNKKVWWKCRICGHEWEDTVKQRDKGKGCPKCNKEIAKVNRELSRKINRIINEL